MEIEESWSHQCPSVPERNQQTALEPCLGFPHMCQTHARISQDDSGFFLVSDFRNIDEGQAAIVTGSAASSGDAQAAEQIESFFSSASFKLRGKMNARASSGAGFIVQAFCLQAGIPELGPD